MPEDQTPIDRQPEPFNPNILRRSVIAVPLREAIDREVRMIDAFEEKHPELLGKYNTAVMFLGETEREITESRERFVRRVQKAEKELRMLPELASMEEPAIGPLAPELALRGSLASLRGRLISLLLAMDAASDPLENEDDADRRQRSPRRRRGSGKRRESDEPLAGPAPAPPAIASIWPTRFEVIIDINLDFKPPESELRALESGLTRPDARSIAKKWIRRYIEEAKKGAHIEDPDQGIDEVKTSLSQQYVFARLEGKVIRELVTADRRSAEQWAEQEAMEGRRRSEEAQSAAAKTGASRSSEDPKEKPAPSPKAARETHRRLTSKERQLLSQLCTIHQIWPDFRLRSCLTHSLATVKADAAHRSFTAHGKGITWAVMDSGIDATHPHFALHNNVDTASSYHKDFTGLAAAGSALQDLYGHGTHVAGIIAGEQAITKGATQETMVCAWRELDEQAFPDPGGAAPPNSDPQGVTKTMAIDAISGIAPECQLVSLKVLDRFGMGNASNAITAIAYVQELNHHGRELHIQGVNLSLGYPFDPKWFACGYSPLCVEVNRLVRSGVVVVVAAGNSGYGTLLMTNGKSTDACLDLTINDPGNAEGAITVGSTHRDMPHVYGVSYFSSKGPTGDGRCKPDLLGPGEKIISCASPASKLVKDEADNQKCNYFETSGTSMAAPHVSGAIAAFLSIRREFIGEPEKVKKIFTSSATDLGRDRYFQGAGLVDLMRAIQSV